MQRLRKYCESRFDTSHITEESIDYIVFNIGIGGNTTDDLLERMDNEIEERFAEDEEAHTIIIGIGGNDSAIEDNTNRVPIERFVGNISKLIEFSRKYTNNIIFIGPIPFDDSKTNLVQWRRSVSYRSGEAERYDEAMKKACGGKGADYISLFKTFSKLDKNKFYVDGVHLNSADHRKIFNIVKNRMLKRIS